jgi:predicted nucleotidyltransferase
MKFGLPDPVILSIQGILKNFPEIEQVLIYGSRAKGNFKPQSDIDLVIKSGSNEAAIDLSTINRIRAVLHSLSIPYSFDLCVYQDIQNQELLDHIDRVGQVLYAKARNH